MEALLTPIPGWQDARPAVQFRPRAQEGLAPPSRAARHASWGSRLEAEHPTFPFRNGGLPPPPCLDLQTGNCGNDRTGKGGPGRGRGHASARLNGGPEANPPAQVETRVAPTTMSAPCQRCTPRREERDAGEGLEWEDVLPQVLAQPTRRPPDARGAEMKRRGVSR